MLRSLAKSHGSAHSGGSVHGNGLSPDSLVKGI